MVLQIVLPGFLPNLLDYERLDLLPENKTLYDFWENDNCDRTYEQYVKTCACVCAAILEAHPEERFELVGHSTGCTVLLDRAFGVLETHAERVERLVLLSPAVAITVPNGRSLVRLTLDANPLSNALFSLLSHVSLSLPKRVMLPPELFPGAPPEEGTLTIRVSEVATYLAAYARIRHEHRESVWDEFEVKVVLADNDLLVDNAAVKRWLPASVTPVTVEGHHETPLHARFVRFKQRTMALGGLTDIRTLVGRDSATRIREILE